LCRVIIERGYLKIAVLVEHFPPRMGSDRRIYELTRRLVGKYEVNFLLIPSFRELCGMLGPNSSSFSGNSKDVYVHEGITAHRIEIPRMIRPLWKKSLKLAYFLTMLLLFPRVIRILKEINPQVVVLNYPSVYTGVLGFLSAKLLRKHCTADFNDLIAQYTIDLLGWKISSPMSRAIVFIQDLIIRNSDAVVSPTDYIRNYALTRARVKDEKIFVIPNGVDVQIFNEEGRSKSRSNINLTDEKVCLYFGRLDEWAGVNILKEISSFFEHKQPDVRFLIVGGGSREWHFPRNVVMVREIPHQKVPDVIAAADVVLVPFPESEVSHAASPLKLFEAMAMRKAVVASMVSGVKEVVTNGYNGLLVDPNRTHEWVEAVQAVLSSKTLQMRLGKNAEESIKKYDWNVLASQFESALSNSTTSRGH
jgi:glycosyltransferase involved in cell wall biosynthesis